MDERVSRQGFTLIELLVVIAIIAILAAILFPAFARCRLNAQRATCQTHQHELYSALMMYTDDFGGRLPHHAFLSYSYDEKHGLMHLYDRYVRNDKIILCPIRMLSTYDGQVYNQAYAYNECLMGALDMRKFDGATECHFILDFDRKRGVGTGRPMGNVYCPSRTPVFFDAFPYPQPKGMAPTGWGWQPEDSYNPDRMTNPHNGGSNYTFLDGHVKWYAPTASKYRYLMATDGLDYEGEGTTGNGGILR